MTDAALEAQLRRLMDVWAERAAEARRKVEQLRYNDPNQAYRQRGMSEAYLAVIGDIESLLVAGTADSTSTAGPAVCGGQGGSRHRRAATGWAVGGGTPSSSRFQLYVGIFPITEQSL